MADFVETMRRDRDAPLPLVIRSRSTNLEDALLRFVRDPKKDLLNGFMFSSIRNEAERTGAMDALKQTDASHVKTWRGIPPLLRYIGVSKDNVDRMESAWARMIELQAKKLIRVECWGTRKPDFKSALGDPAKLVRNLLTEQGREIAETTFRFEISRNEMDGKFSAYRSMFAGLYRESGDLEVIESLYHRAYNLAISMQHQCDNFETTHRDALPGCMPKPSKGLSLPPQFLLGLGAMPGWQYQGLWRDHRHGFEHWWRTGDLDAIRRSVEPYVKMAMEDNHASQFWTMAREGGISAGTKIILGGILGLAAIPIGVLLAGAVEYIYRQDFNSTILVTQRIVRNAEARKADEKNH
ncbi:MAG: hypothetical protein PHP88_05665 [bacterium]|nr:hypothetical protein [bacterium]